MTPILTKAERERAIIQKRQQNKVPRIDEVTAKSKQELQRLRNHIKRPVFPNLSTKEFARLITIEGEKAMARRAITAKFIIDSDNKEFIRELYYWITGNPQFFGDLDKGWWVYGKYGTGKTIIMEAAWTIYMGLQNKTALMVPAKEIGDKARKFGYDYFKKRPMEIDDVGREEKQINVFGNKSKPMLSIISRRYDSGVRAFTWMTAQHAIKEMKSNDGALLYGKAVLTRMIQMMNQYELKGPNRRK
jgi:DNA replication protein DnaC